MTFLQYFEFCFSTHNTAGLIQKNPWISPGANLFQSTKPQGLRQFRQLEIVEEEAISIHEATRASTANITKSNLITQT